MSTVVMDRTVSRAAIIASVMLGCLTRTPQDVRAQTGLASPEAAGVLAAGSGSPTPEGLMLGYDLQSGQLAPMPDAVREATADAGPTAPPDVAFVAAAFDLLEPVAGALGAADHVIGTDDRRWVSQTTDTPYRAVVHLELVTRSGRPAGTCSGSLVRPQIVLTAGHCVYGSAFGGYIGQVRVIPARSGGNAPFGWQAADWVFASSGWQSTQSFDHDWAIVHLPDRSLSTRVGSYFYPVAFNYGAGTPLTITGFPGDLEQRYGAAYMWTSTSQVTYVPAGGAQFHTDADAMPGNSGGPCWFVGRTQTGLIPAQIGVVSNQQFYDAAQRYPYNACATVPESVVDWLYEQP